MTDINAISQVASKASILDLGDAPRIVREHESDLLPMWLCVQNSLSVGLANPIGQQRERMMDVIGHILLALQYLLYRFEDLCEPSVELKESVLDAYRPVV